MKVQTVTVEIHEKRNSPNSYGNYDSRVAYTATLDESEDADTVINELKNKARQHVVTECDNWVAGIELESKCQSARSTVEAADNEIASLKTKLAEAHSVAIPQNIFETLHRVLTTTIIRINEEAIDQKRDIWPSDREVISLCTIALNWLKGQHVAAGEVE